MKKRLHLHEDRALLFKKEGNNYWLRKPSFDCGWYWGLGYLATGRGSHLHYDNYFEHNPFYSAEIETPFNQDERYMIADLMKQLYTLRNMADMYHIGGAHITGRAHTVFDEFKEDNTKEYKRICNVLIPAVWNQLVDTLLDEQEDRDKLYIPLKEYV